MVAPMSAEVRLPSAIGSHMVLQRDMPVRVWGWAEPGEAVTVSFAGASASARADAEGAWSAMLPAQGASAEGRTLTVAGANTIELTDVLVGEVWLASGQSNMAWTVARSADAEAEVAAAEHPQIRMWSAANTVATEPQNDVNGNWRVCSPQTVGNFSAVGYFFARELHAQLGVPVGILHSSWGGTPVEAWTSTDRLKQMDVAEPILQRFAQAVEGYDKTKAEYEQQLQRFRESRTGPANTGFDAGFAQPGFDDAQWEPMAVPSRWEDKELHVDGVVWFRRTVAIPEAWAGKELVLELGPIDDGDTTYFNNHRVGHTRPDQTNSWQQPRSYRVPGDKVQAGAATLAVRVVDTGGYGGMYGNADALKLYPAEGDGQDAINLAGDWKHHVAHQIDPRNNPTRAPSLPFGPEHQHSPAGLYNGMIAPLVPYTLRGFIWYQGESNGSRAEQYETLFPGMIQDWRARWGQGDLPFLFVQLANYRQPEETPSDTDWAHLRDAQLKTLRTLPNTGMATIIDIGEAEDIHPRNKQDVGKRLAAWALHHYYGKTEVVPSGPIYQTDSLTVEGNRAAVGFETFGSGLAVRGEGPLQGFTVAGPDNRFHLAQAEIRDGRVVVWSEQVPNPKSVRYAWANNPIEANLINEKGLPASPFRTDDLPGPTDGRR